MNSHKIIFITTSHHHLLLRAPSAKHLPEVGSSSGSGCGEEVVNGGGESGGSGDGEEDVEELIVRRLEELRLDATDVELTEEWSINDQLQEDELLAMKFIYEENVCFLDKWNGMRSFQIHIHIKIPGELMVSAKFPAANNPMPQGAGMDDFSYSFEVQYLPPIVLSCLFPRSYLSLSPPLFTISVQWLDTVRISSLCSMLHSLWKDQAGLEIMYRWVEWLQDCSLSYLGFDDGVVLGPSDVASANSGSISPE
ncbi:E3 ubiquitin-protein ligase RNF14-like protein, partial [Drosera capensis]